MKSEYVENFNAIRASEASKQKAVSALMQYLGKKMSSTVTSGGAVSSGAASGGTASRGTVSGGTTLRGAVSGGSGSKGAGKRRERFTWSIGRITAAASTAAVLIFCAIFIPLFLSPSHGGNNKTKIDYYREYTLKLPFEHTPTNSSDVLYFNTPLTMEQMCEGLNESGYTASLHGNENLKKIFITASKNGFLYYFIIYDKSYLSDIHGENSVYTLGECSAMISVSADYEGKEPHIYMFLFPRHFSGLWTDKLNGATVKIYCTFDEFARFYTATGKNDAQIDAENKTVTFFCRGQSDYSWIRGNIVLQYVESENGNYIDIRPKS